MATFTAPVDLKIKWNGLEISGATGVTHRIPDALYEEFVADVVPRIPGGVTWVTTDEIGSISTPAHSSLTGVTANQHHNQAHAIDGADHTGTLTHAALGSVTANQHHNQVHSISGSDHTGTLTHAALGSVTADQHHAQSHDHSAAGDGSTLRPGTIIIPSGSVKMNAATAFPGSPTADDLCYRTDYNLWFFYDGTRWLTETLFEALHSTQFGFISATTGVLQRLPLPHSPWVGDIWVEDCEMVVFVNTGGTALSASHKWVGSFQKTDSAGAVTTIGTCTIDSGNSNEWRRVRADVDAVVAQATYFNTEWTFTKTGTPGNLAGLTSHTYRLIAT